MDIAKLADYLQITSFVFSVCLMIGASISIKLRTWIKSIVKEAIHELFNDNSPS